MNSIRKRALCLLLCLLTMTTLAAPAALADGVEIHFSDPRALLNGNVTVVVQSSTAVAGINLTLVYDSDYLTYKSCSGGLGNANVNNTGSSLIIVDNAGSGAAMFTLNLNFTAKKTGTTEIKAASASASNADGDTVDVTCFTSTVTIGTASSDATLSGLTIDPGSLSPAFSSSVTQYTATVANATTWIAVTAKPNDAAASAYVAGHASLAVGQNTVTVTVTAGDGTQKVYTILVTRQAAGAAATAAPAASASATPSATASPGATVYAKVSDGTRMEIGNFSASSIPAGYSAAVIDFNGASVPAAQNADKSRTIVWLKANDSNAAGFYLFDAETGTAAPMNELVIASRSYAVLDAATYEGGAPEGCVLGSYTLGGASHQVFVPEAAGAEYVIFYGSAGGGSAALYLYDTRDGTALRWGLDASAEPEATPTPSPTADPAAVGALESAQKEALTMKRAALTVTVAALGLLILSVALGIALMRAKSRRDGE